MWRTLNENEIKELIEKYNGKKIKIVNMEGEPRYNGRIGKVNRVDSAGQLHGDWGGLAVNVEEDTIEIL